METKIKVCFKCKNKITEDSHYYSICEMKDCHMIKTDYVHKVCWDVFMNQLNGANNSLKKSNFLLNAMGKQMQKMGMIPEEEVIIQ